MYGRESALGVFDLLQATQQDFSERWYFSNHSLSCFRSVNVNRLVTSMWCAIVQIRYYRQLLPIPAKQPLRRAT